APLQPGEFRLSLSPAPLPGPLDACPFLPHRRTSDALHHCVSRPSPVAAVTFHRISCYHCAASASAAVSDQPLRAAEVAPPSSLQSRAQHRLCNSLQNEPPNQRRRWSARYRRLLRAQRLRQRSPHRPSRLHSRAPPSPPHSSAALLLPALLPCAAPSTALLRSSPASHHSTGPLRLLAAAANANPSLGPAPLVFSSVRRNCYYPAVCLINSADNPSPAH
ncbi:hypothetical protein U1Q18_042965, partial [Sarracenia purpurea var. burkii]